MSVAAIANAAMRCRMLSTSLLAPYGAGLTTLTTTPSVPGHAPAPTELAEGQRSPQGTNLPEFSECSRV